MYLAQRQAAQIRNLVLIAGFSTTFVVWTSLADPINLPKLFVLAVFAAWILGAVISNIGYSRIKRMALGQWAIVGFVGCILLAALLTDVKYTAFFGAMQRNDGAFAYIALASLSLAATMAFTPSDLRQIRLWIIIVGSLLSFYGLLQTFGHDPFKWVLLYNHVVGTLGNPDFFSGIVGAAAIASVWLILVEEEIRYRAAGLVILLVELFVLKRCGSIQGIGAFTLGLVILFVTKLWQFRKKVAIFSTVAIGVVSIPVFLGLIDKGPLARYVYRGSFQSRVDYWHAALGMFKSHPLAGVGLDRFGQYYGAYAPQVQVVHNQATDNAHNVFLQLLSTGGLLVIVPYLFLLSVIFASAIRAIRSSVGNARIDTVALFSIWLALLFISAISIDNLGVAVWFWIIGGVLYGISRHHLTEKPAEKRSAGKSAKPKSSDSSNLLAPIVSLVLSIVVLVAMVPAWRSSAMLLQLQRQRTGWTEAQYVDAISKAANVQASNVQVRVQLADIALRVSAFDTGQGLIKSILTQDHRSLDGNTLGAIANELTKNYQAALPYRLRLLELDPWGTRNMLQLITDYIALKDLPKARELSARLSQLYPNSADANSANALLKG